MEPSPPAARSRVFYQSAAASRAARTALETTLVEMQAEQGEKLRIDEPSVHVIHEYEHAGAFGLDLPEALLVEAYIRRQDVSPAVGWETAQNNTKKHCFSIVFSVGEAYFSRNSLGPIAWGRIS